MTLTSSIPFLNIKLGLTFGVTTKVFFLLLGEKYMSELSDDSLWSYGWLKWGGCLILECFLGLLTYGVDSLDNLLTNPLGVENGVVSC